MPAMVLLHHTFEPIEVKPIMGMHGPFVPVHDSTAVQARQDHYDWLLPWRAITKTGEMDEKSLLAFRVSVRIDDASVTEFLAQLLPPHRRHYLIFEGEISPVKGSVKRVSRGQFTKLQTEPAELPTPVDLKVSPKLVMVSVRGHWPAWPSKILAAGEYTWAGWPLDEEQRKGLPEGEPWWFFKRSAPHRMIKPSERWRDDDRLADYVKMAARF
jgi:hypothetical protein